VNEGRREMRVEDERERMARDEDEWVTEEAGEGGGAGRGWSKSDRGRKRGKGKPTLSWARAGEACEFQCAISCTMKRRARTRSCSSKSWSSAGGWVGKKRAS